MNIQDEFSVILYALRFAGFNASEKNYRLELTLKEKLRNYILYIYEVVSILFAIILIFTSIFSLTYDTPIIKFTSASLHVILFLIRLSLFLKRSQLRKTLRKLRIFARNGCTRSIYRNYALFACSVSFVIPLIVAISATVVVLGNSTEHKDITLIGDETGYSYNIYMIGFVTTQILYTVNFLVFPGLVMTFLSFMYLSYIDAVKRHFEAELLNILRNFSHEAISKCLNIFMVANRIHRDMEKSLSLTAFLTYVLTFGNILNIVCIFAVNFLSNMQTLRSLYTNSVFIWTISWFVFLTICGSRATELGYFLKNIVQEVATKSLRYPPVKSSRDLMYLQLFDACSKLNLNFTAWGMFRLNKRLLLTTSGVLVTYGILFASEIRGISAMKQE
ncbi:hypothetical protein JTE90_028640 [Oedothorax gibbosus]|uniref:Gustatory receptor n=2 Tax=Oedothorax gibbosus TaxID=931172 RepID=A0AAV6UXC6_9ARAC|nr:hypothetical protein JTE90_028640 [Oedothorax gibbosus]